MDNFETPNITGYEIELIIKIAERMNWDLSNSYFYCLN